MKKSKNYLQIVVLSGKGGTGKTTFTAAFAELADNKIVIDCDVDAANLYLLLNPNIESRKDFYGGKKAEIDISDCTKCGLCEELCTFNAISDFKVNAISCEGCGLCFRACPEKAISFETQKSGVFYLGHLEDKSEFYYAKLFPGEGNSGKLVSEIKKEASHQINDKTEWIIIDGPPGIGCPVNASLSDADYVVLITEPSLSAVHDLQRLIKLLKTFKYPYGIIINKCDLNFEITKTIRNLAIKDGMKILGEVPFNEDFVNSLRMNKTVIKYNPLLKKDLADIWNQIKQQSQLVNN